MLQHHVYLLEFRIVDNFYQADDIWMPNLLQDSDFPLCLILGRDCDPPEPSFLREALYNFDRNILLRVQAACKFDLSMYTAPNFVDDLVLIDQFPPGYKILFDLCLVCPVVRKE